MYKLLTIGGKDYKLEYTIEASLYAECVTSLTILLANIQNAGISNDISQVLKETGNIPQVALTVFYAGLMEAHGTHPKGDKSVPDKETAKELMIQYIREHKDDETGNFYGILRICADQMGEDDFLELTGMNAILNEGTNLVKAVNQRQKKTKKTSEKQS